jgi:hypothetical protein
VEGFTTGWNAEADAKLQRLVATKGKQWKVIAEEMGRSPDLVRLRYQDYVSLGNNRTTGFWSKEDTRKLYGIVTELLQGADWTEDEGLELDIVSKYVNWDTVSKKMGNRSRLQCLKRWSLLDIWKASCT